MKQPLIENHGYLTLGQRVNANPKTTLTVADSSCLEESGDPIISSLCSINQDVCNGLHDNFVC